MVLSNAQSQASPARRDQENCEHELVGYKSPKARPVSEEPRNQSFRSGRNDRKGRDVVCGTGGHTAGGTIKQLIAETLEELEETESRADKLRSRLVQLSNLLESVESQPIEDVQQE
ncbi:MAG: hypothetical protein KME23_17710 [Goleter apudmare HA4340-LM2]|jgi:hypothetical protein|nr:hypothetical protein [Goleter apudmare HA4340-LM2]MBW4644798.1 hypothetical protein [Goleter apudmare HA4340-LM2]